MKQVINGFKGFHIFTILFLSHSKYKQDSRQNLPNKIYHIQKHKHMNMVQSLKSFKCLTPCVNTKMECVSLHHHVTKTNVEFD